MFDDAQMARMYGGMRSIVQMAEFTTGQNLKNAVMLNETTLKTGCVFLAGNIC
jgi:hypothetical protein